MNRQKVALFVLGGVVAFGAADYFFAVPGPARIVDVERKIEAKRALLPGNDDIVAPGFVDYFLPVRKQVVCHEEIMRIERGQVQVGDELWAVVRKGDSLILRYRLGRFTGLVYDPRFDARSVKVILSQREAKAETVPDSPTPSAGGGIAVADATASSSTGLSPADLAAKYDSSDPATRLKAIVTKTAAVGENPTAYNRVVTSGDEALDVRLVQIRHATMSGRSDAQKEIQLEVSESILDASDPFVTPGGRISPDKAARLSRLVATWDQLASQPSTAAPAAPQTSNDPTDRLKLLVPRLRKQLNRSFVPFVQWDAVAAHAEAEQLLQAVQQRGRVTGEQVDTLVSLTKRMERAK